MKNILPIVLLALLGAGWVQAETISIAIPTNASPRVEFGAEKIVEALKAVKLEAPIEHTFHFKEGQDSIIIGYQNDTPINGLVESGQIHFLHGDPVGEGFAISSHGAGIHGITANSDSGLLYGCLEMADCIRAAGKLPYSLDETENPAMKLRGACIGLQQPAILPGRKVYEYPITPELFPWFYDKKMWTKYLDFLAENRMNSLYLWAGHPFASLVRLKDYPYAVEVPDDVFARNQEMYHWLAQECDKRGIWLVQMFYNILVSKPFAETNGISTQLSAPTPLTEDYTRKSIAEFVKDYPNIGLLVCLGEALQGTENQLEWCTNVILPGVLGGMKAAGLKEEPPIVIRTHAMDPYAIMPAVYGMYSNLFTMSKYNGESLTTWEPRGKDADIHRAMSNLGPHIVNVHILADLEPFRYGDTEFIKKCVQASLNSLDATGLHLYPLSYWNWPYSPDIAGPPELQWQRDWIWFEAWARYSWNPDVPEKEDHAYWISRLADFYGNTNAAEKIYEAYNSAGEVAPRLIRRFGITEGNRQTLSLGMALDELVNPNKHGAIDDLWLSQAPPGERLDEFVEKEWKHEPHAGETPETIITDVLAASSNAVAAADAAAKWVTTNRDESERLRNDTRCIQAMARNYSDKVRAAELVLRYNYSHDAADLDKAEKFLAASLGDFQQLAALGDSSYHFANSMQTSHRRIPVIGAVKGKPANYLWSQLLPVYEDELKNFEMTVSKTKAGENIPLVETNTPKMKGNPELAEPQ